jgi:DNA mismatch repair ATPase MutL
MFTTKNEPNAAKLMDSLRYLGYDNYSAICDLVDNALDAEAKVIHINISQVGGEPVISIADDGCGMDERILDEALKLGSLTDRNSTSDLGK